MEEAKNFLDRVDTLARMISEDSEAMIIAIKRQDRDNMTPIIIKAGDPFAVNGLADFVQRTTSDHLQYEFSEYYSPQEEGEEGEEGED